MPISHASYCVLNILRVSPWLKSELFYIFAVIRPWVILVKIACFFEELLVFYTLDRALLVVADILKSDLYRGNGDKFRSCLHFVPPTGRKSKQKWRSAQDIFPSLEKPFNVSNWEFNPRCVKRVMAPNVLPVDSTFKLSILSRFDDKLK